ncbi:transcriptional regulator [Pseudoflavonifractor sp. 524-17]|uniref:LCP family protein n=1 Tax=Pseudoflavonifractor sp. 524-17 TaxID=2304577 RepID=UPI0013798E3C|nr:LCP family protein [Pseudoflavonifractor sp. 524-17]NCE65633.1 transcriptional regulator [Pseudoflavonifractor sp. 524-17]
MESDKKDNRRGGARLQRKPSQREKRRRASEGAKETRSKKKLTPQETVLWALIIIAGVLAVILISLVVAWRLFARKPELPAIPDVPELPQVSGEDINFQRPDRTKSDRKTDFFTFLVIGRDTGGGGNTDTILLAAYDVPNQKLNVMSIPRDTMVNVPWDIKRINSVYNYYNGGEEGIDALKKEISQLVGFVPDFQVVVEWDAVGELVDAIGGVYFDVPRNMNYDDPTQNLHIHINKGYQKLSGSQAMGVIRYRHDNDRRYGYPDGDLGRIKTQQAFLKEVVAQCLKIENMTKVNQLAKVFTDNVSTDLSINNLAWFAEKAIFGGLKMENVSFMTMPNEGQSVYSRTYGNYQSYVTPVADELMGLVNECFNPYTSDLEFGELDIMGVDSSGRIYSSTGYVEDTKAGGGTGGSSRPGGAQTTYRPDPTPPASQEPDAPDEPDVTRPPATQRPQTPEPPVPTQLPDPAVLPSVAPEPDPSPTPDPAPTPAPEVTSEPVPTPEPAPDPTSAPPAETLPPAAPDPSEGEVAPPPESLN